MFQTETAETVFLRTYSRKKPDGSQETWPETVTRVVDGNLSLVEPRYIEAGERQALIDLIQNFKFLPAGRHLKSSGVNNFALNNCWAAGWSEDPAEHYTFTLLRLAEGGGVGSNYSSRYLDRAPTVENCVTTHIVCDPAHPDYEDLSKAGLISAEYDYAWAGAYSVEDSREGWAWALGDLIRSAHEPTMKHHNRVFDVSRIRGKGAPLRSFGGTASGPEPFARMMIEVGQILSEAAGWPLNGMDAMSIDHQIAMAIVAGGVRRSARMSIMHWDDSLIEEFLTCKSSDTAAMWTTNVSVEIDATFMKALDEKNPRAQKIMKAIAEGALGNGEPGFWNSTLTAEGEVDGTYTTNPCGEATLNPWEPCNLGSVNLGKFVHEGEADFTDLEDAHRLATRYLIRATFAEVADPKSAQAIQKYRRIGVGHLGFADYLFKLGVKYSRAPYNPSIRFDLAHFANTVDRAAAEYANELRIPVPIKKRVIAPTGTTSKLASASGEGIHPPFADFFLRRIRFSSIEPTEKAQIEAYERKGYRTEPCVYSANTVVVEIPTVDPLLPDYPECADAFEHSGELTLDQMLSVQRMYQELWADQAVSYTASVNPETYTVTDVYETLRGFLPVLKGTTIFPEMSRPQSPYERISKEEYEKRMFEIGEVVADTGYDEVCASGACPI
ncbi:ribonucleoside-triphosphate reductase, adenosylcobalamin-dependent [Streptomyces sp. NRRL F-2580]|uniref:ribonucleoside-triphosphate reductase, adenosylcobalamin-dependent n=1 Tax=Streptomyces sp. NRRL F-2580 TaxID=1463841 RepID=UPI0004CC2313|nr:ribonucleoside-triphosphate reductase, adenosylcobalamin-dependent [Streptomyces sp. NRRL F-2580]